MTYTKYDPYAECDQTCTHDLAHGVTLADLHHDGPYPPLFSLSLEECRVESVGMDPKRPAPRFDTDRDA